ncbi:MAG: DUF3307 domain-containing protein [Pseudomonadota bacterium]
MIETFAALLFAHVLADFPLQTDRMAATKHNPATLARHGAIVSVTAYIALGRYDTWVPLALAVAHIVIDIVKINVRPQGLATFFADQTAHLATLFATALFFPGLFAAGIWSAVPALAPLMALAAGLMAATIAGGHILRVFVARWEDETINLPKGLPGGGRLIGLLERGIIFLLVLTNQAAGVGFLIAAKSVLRFDTTRKDHTAGEYVIIGTLASFGWAMVVSWLTLALLATMHPLGILPPTP